MTHAKGSAHPAGQEGSEGLSSDPSLENVAFPEFSQEVKKVWNHNASYWDGYMGEGNDFVEGSLLARYSGVARC